MLRKPPSLARAWTGWIYLSVTLITKESESAWYCECEQRYKATKRERERREKFKHRATHWPGKSSQQRYNKMKGGRAKNLG